MPQAPFTASATPIGELFAASHFRPAAVQRGYEWSEQDALQLLGDIDTVFAPTWDEVGGEVDAADVLLVHEPVPAYAAVEPPADAYFIGALVLVEVEPGFFHVYDGLQRITTLSILFAVLRDLEEDPLANLGLHALVMGPDHPRLALATRDGALQRDVQEDRGTLRHRKKNAGTPIGKSIQGVKNALLGKLEGMEPARRRAFADFLRRRVFACVIRVGEARLGRQVFVSTNLFGKRLQPLDLLRGQLLDLARSEEDAQDLAAAWNAARERAGDDFEGLLWCVDAITRRAVQGPSWTTDLGYALADVDLHEWMPRLSTLAQRWKELGAIRWTGGTNTFEHELWRLWRLPWPEWQPLALLLFEEHRAERDPARRAHLETVADRFVRRCMAVALVGFSDGNRRVVFARALDQWVRDRDPTTGGGALVLRKAQRIKIDRTLTTQLRDDAVARCLLEWLESTEWRDELPKLLDHASLEHVLPRRPEEPPDGLTWAAHDADCYALGNLAVIPWSVNERISNWPYALKRPELLPLAEHRWTLRTVTDHETWGSAEIAARTALLAARTWDELGITRP
jgi:Protein of unknown function DUF262/Protein of unknown function (DUF1524)